MIDAIYGELEKHLGMLAGRAEDSLAAPVSYAVPGGKRLRGMLLVLAGEGRAVPGELLRAAACLELLHAATLVQDDIFDRSGTRRGRPAVHCVFGPRLATLASDWMLAEAMRAAYRLDIAFGEALSGCAEALIDGEAREFAPSGPAGAASLRAKAAAIARGKTGELFGLALSAASVLEGSPSRAARLRDTGCALGVAFQYLDDALDLYGDAREVGKDLRRDTAARLWTLPMLDAWAMLGCDLPEQADLLQGGAVHVLAAQPAKTLILAKARAQWQTALQCALEELPADCAVSLLLQGVAGKMLAPTEALESRSAA